MYEFTYDIFKIHIYMNSYIHIYEFTYDLIFKISCLLYSQQLHSSKVK